MSLFVFILFHSANIVKSRMEDDLSLHLQSVWQSSKIGFYCLNAAASAELVEIFFLWSVWLGQSVIDGVEG